MARRFSVVVILFVLFISSPLHAFYSLALASATKSGRVHDIETWDAKIIWHATFFSDKFRRAYEEKHSKIHHLSAVETAHFVAEQERRQSQGWDFFIGVYTKKDYKKFSSNYDSFWKLKLVTKDGASYAPETVDMIPITPYEQRMYSYLNRWSRAYRVTFPKIDLSEGFELTAESVVGESTLKWKSD